MQNTMSSLSTLVSCSAMDRIGWFCIVQTLPRKLPVAVLILLAVENYILFVLYIPLNVLPLELSWLGLSV